MMRIVKEDEQSSSELKPIADYLKIKIVYSLKGLAKSNSVHKRTSTMADISDFTEA